MLRVDNLSVTYKDTKQKALSGLSFELKKGEILTIMGASGCGKSTLLNIIQGLLTEREIVLAGEITIPENAIVRTVFQEARLLPWRTVAENISFALEAIGVDKSEANRKSLMQLKSLELEKFADFYPDQLSVGMKQRVNFARAMVCKPDILLLDEPFSAVDHETKEKLIPQLLDKIEKEKITTLFVTHNKSEAERVGGRLIKTGELRR